MGTSADTDQGGGRPPYRLIGLGTMTLGLFIILISANVIPVADSRFSAPRWIAGCAGLSFLLAGAAVALARPGATPNSIAANPYLGGAAALVLVLILNWIAFGAGPRHFSGGVAIPFVSWSGPSSDWTGRAAFGICAAIMDFIVVWLLIRGVRGAFHRRER
ncbi:MAG TPA: hypothetical protein VGV06_10280 [Methylomirabilota bacterium]|nr:hypothetical protein [Methylomirabilota bacterium]